MKNLGGDPFFFHTVDKFHSVNNGRKLTDLLTGCLS